MKKLLALFLATSLLIPTQAYAATSKPTPKPSVTKAKVVKTPATKKPIIKKPIVKKTVVKRKKKLPEKKPLKWPPGGFEKKGELYAKTATPKELLIAGTENKYIQKNLIAYCHKVACLGIFVGSETGCDWWEINSNVLGIDPNNSTERVILGSLITLVSGSKAKTIKAILLTSEEPIADGLGIGAYTANCRIGIPTGKIPSNTYTITPNRS
ncbi:MAG: hypothetical protein F2653_02740 [Actinobacteria bacterium]|uniref:Unannotated protein n=1 Tax=freshwater metagenome TaxID=449393 RepID=A0A6J6QWB6_9ZZZZ|nr:hypothetical protein [Actinomycetota bacterium]MSW22800.1 hypothetical protein [Actinomycetota bacterium]MSX04230.1 hypothetical protein [Actinomycetota bacterium]MSX84634.1 hypothetical protein [Actinomycetota bacterium]MSY96338.1 hypothetical protein [Actinomycetota bacterium]